MKIRFFSILFFLIVFSISFTLLRFQSLPLTGLQLSSQVVHEGDFYLNKIQPILNSRCIACHSCLESPCQLNLQSYEGVIRGAIQGFPVYNGTRLQSVSPTRMYEDAQSTKEWRAKGFHNILGDSKFSMMNSVIALANQRWIKPTLKVADSQYCAKNQFEFNIEAIKNDNANLAMPFGLPAIALEDQKLIEHWVAMGSPGPKSEFRNFPKHLESQIHNWETLLNKKELKYQITARYLFEHLFLAHLYFQIEDQKFFKLVRSKSECSIGVIPISSNTPNSDPGTSEWFYCFVNDPSTVVYKNHIPYELSQEKLNWIEKNFIESNWTPKEFPSFSKEFASNPFKTFKDIPIKTRYEFLLKDAQYHIMTFIKGPVCNGTMAVNSIQEQFYVFFMSPDSDLMSVDSQYFEQVLADLDLPGAFGAESKPAEILSSYRALLSKRNNYRKAKTRYLEKIKPQGLKLEDIWDGDSTNENALLTVLRHDDNAKVVKGAFGDIPKTAFLLDYSIFERLVYNLVVNFDVFSNVGHQTLTRLYMDFIRMEAENNFLDFLPIEQRKALKKDWYRGSLTGTQLRIFEEMQFANIPSGIEFKNSENSKSEFIQKIIFKRFNSKVRGRIDSINWKMLLPNSQALLSDSDKEISKLASVRGVFTKYFPELSFLILKKNGVLTKGYSLVRHREHQNVSWIIGESFRLSPDEDTLSIARGYYGAYPNRFFSIEESELGSFVDSFLKVRNRFEFYEVFQKYAMDRMNPEIWSIYDFINEDLKELDPVGAGYIDLSRYEL